MEERKFNLECVELIMHIVAHGIEGREVGKIASTSWLCAMHHV